MKLLSKSIGHDQINKLDAVFVTHEHHDHIKGLNKLVAKFDLPVYINQASLRAKAHQLRNVSHSLIAEDSRIQINDLTVVPFSVKHDTDNTFGFRISEKNGSTLCYLTDSGIISEDNMLIMDQADVLMIEFNYSTDMLWEYPDYPDYLKERISEYHLSNRQAIDALDKIGIDTFDLIIPAHLSPRTNSPEQVTTELTECFPNSMHRFAIAPFNQPLDIERMKLQNHELSSGEVVSKNLES